jgi:choline dehydrogenase-like flavoprotein
MISHDPVPLVVVGLGAAGGTIAVELAARGIDVVGLEAGSDVRLSETARLFDDDEVGHLVDRRRLHREPEVFFLDGRPLPLAPWLARNTGVGGPHTWTGFSYRFHPSDFRVASTSGVPVDTSVADWPISYDDLEPWYEAAESLAGVAAEAGENPYEARRRGPYPSPANPVGAGADRLGEAARSLGLHPYRPPAAIRGRAVGGAERGGAELRGDDTCDRCGTCTFYGCHRDAKFSTLVAGLDEARQAGRVEVRAEATVTEVVCDGGGRPVAVRYLDGGGGAHEQPAMAIVLALNAPYVARLLLMSRGPDHPGGIGNATDQVGRHLTFHTGAFAYGVYDDVIDPDRGPAQHVGIDDLNEDRPWREGAGFRRGGVLHAGMPAAFTGGPLAFARALDVTIPLPEGVPRHGSGLLDFAAASYRRHQACYVLGEDLPQFDNRVRLDEEVRDSRGLPALRIEYRPHPEDRAQHDALLDTAADLLSRSGAHTVIKAPSEIPGGIFAGHAHGVTRMGDDPERSVADSFGLVHGTDNLFVAGAGLFVTSAGLNPALTILALALRSVERIASSVRV